MKKFFWEFLTGWNSYQSRRRELGIGALFVGLGNVAEAVASVLIVAEIADGQFETKPLAEGAQLGARTLMHCGAVILLTS